MADANDAGSRGRAVAAAYGERARLLPVERLNEVGGSRNAGASPPGRGPRSTTTDRKRSLVAPELHPAQA